MDSQKNLGIKEEGIKEGKGGGGSANKSLILGKEGDENTDDYRRLFSP